MMVAVAATDTVNEYLIRELTSRLPRIYIT